MLELTARHADAWNLAWFGLPDERLGARARRPGDGVRARRAATRRPSRSRSGSRSAIRTGWTRQPADTSPGIERTAGRHRRGPRHTRRPSGPTTRSSRSSRACRRRSRGSPRRSRGSARADALRSSIRAIGQARAVARRPQAAELEQADDAGPLPGVRLEQLEHPVVGAARLAGQRPRHEVRQVEVADAHGVRGRPAPGRRPRPRSTARARARPSAARGPRRVAGRRSPRTTPPARHAPDEVGPPPLDAERVIGVIGEARPGSSLGGGRRTRQPAARAVPARRCRAPG